MKILLPIAAAGFVALTAVANATPVSVLPSDMGTCTLDQLTESTDCEGAYAGNDDADLLNMLEVFDKTGWSQLAKVDDDRGTDGDLDVSVTLENGDGEGIEGEWSYTGDISAFDHMIAVLKAGNAFTAYLLDLSVTPLEGTWNTAGLDDKGLSHFSLYTRTGGGGGGGLAPVPLPAAGWMLLAGVGGLAAWGRKRRRS